MNSVFFRLINTKKIFLSFLAAGICPKNLASARKMMVFARVWGLQPPSPAARLVRLWWCYGLQICVSSNKAAIRNGIGNPVVTQPMTWRNLTGCTENGGPEIVGPEKRGPDLGWNQKVENGGPENGGPKNGGTEYAGPTVGMENAFFVCNCFVTNTNIAEFVLHFPVLHFPLSGLHMDQWSCIFRSL